MLSEYKQYLQILGFNPIQVESPRDIKTYVRTNFFSPSLDLDYTYNVCVFCRNKMHRALYRDEENAQQSYYLKKSMLGGVLLFEIHLSQPFFIVKLSIIECSRLQTKTSSGMMNQVR